MVRVTPDQWNELRINFNRSLLVDTSLASLAENIDGCVWPLSGPEETASAYIDLTFPEVINALLARGLPPTRLDNLVEILRGTMAFDESFGDMAGIASKAEAETDPVKRNLDRLDISPDFPVTLCNFTPGMLDFCAREGMEKLTDFLGFTRSASRQVFISGEFQELLNAISHIDEQVIARFLPFRVHSTGLHLVEGLAFVLRPLTPEARALVVKRPESLPPAGLALARRYAAYFAEEMAQMRAASVAGTPLSRLAAPLDNLELEPALASLLGLLIRESIQAVEAAEAAAKAKLKAEAEAKAKAEAEAAAKAKAEAAAAAKAKAAAEEAAVKARQKAEAEAAAKAKAEAAAAKAKAQEQAKAAAEKKPASAAAPAMKTETNAPQGKKTDSAAAPAKPSPDGKSAPATASGSPKGFMGFIRKLLGVEK